MKWDMPIRPIESGPLTDREIKELDAFLLAEDSHCRPAHGLPSLEQRGRKGSTSLRDGGRRGRPE
jgi:hypothetical protein